MSMRHERRRRLLTDDTDHGDAAPIRLASGSGEAEDAQHTYSDAARAARMRGVCTLLPLSRMAIALYLSACLAAVGTCLGVHLAAAALEPGLGKEAVAVLRLDGPASLGRWLASAVLGLAAATAVFIYSLRRHRLDDYHGRYRAWILATMVCLILSLAESTALTALVRALVRLGTDWAHVRFDVLWPAATAVLASAVALRLAIEMRRCGPALTTLGLSLLSFVASAAVYGQWPVIVSEAAAPFWGRGCWLTGYLLILASFFLYGRQVQLEVAGATAVPTRPKRKKPVEQPKDSAAQPAPRKMALKLRTDLDPVAVANSEPARTSESKPAAVTLKTEPQSERQHLSRADRRKQRQDRRMAS